MPDEKRQNDCLALPDLNTGVKVGIFHEKNMPLFVERADSQRCVLTFQLTT